MISLQILAKGRIVPDSVYFQGKELLVTEAAVELIFLIGAYAMLTMVLNGFDVPAP